MSTETWALAAAIITMAAMSAVGIAYARTRRQNIEDFVSARGSIGGATAMATMTASLLGAWILFSPAEAATWAGMAALIGYGIGQAAPIVAFTIVGPRMRKLAPNGHSLSEFVWQRYGRAMYVLTLLIILLYMFTFLAAEMGAIARAVGAVADAPLLLTLVLVGAATLAYTVYGGLRASIFTDNIQFAVIIPLLLAVLVAVFAHFGGWTKAFDTVREENAALLDVTQLHGIEFGLTLVIAILAANLFHQGLWQRVYAARTDDDIRRGFLTAGAIVVPLIVAAGLFGFWAVSGGLVNDDHPASIALFTLALEVLPGWALVILLALALMLVMSSMDTLLNGMASVFTTNLSRIRGGRGLLGSTRLITALLIIPAAVVGFAFDSVLYLFLIADLVCAGAMVPVFAGMWSRRLSGTGAAVGAVAGIGVGALFFPTRTLSGWWTWDGLTNVWHILASGNLLASFLLAVAVSSGVTGLFILAARRRNAREFNLEALADEIRPLESGV
ncbi:MAG: Na+/proline symporter [Chloroflexi bacterium]|nr:Na+/proline symporter [Chloroflexota bacterium]